MSHPWLCYSRQKRYCPARDKGICSFQETMHPVNVQGFSRGNRSPRDWLRFTLSLVVLLAAGTPASMADRQSASPEHGLDQIRSYIALGWDSLTRSLTDCKTIVDPKLAAASVMYIPADLDVPAMVQQLQKQCHVQVQHLPAVIHHLGEMDSGKIDPAGLLYLGTSTSSPADASTKCTAGTATSSSGPGARRPDRSCARHGRELFL